MLEYTYVLCVCTYIRTYIRVYIVYKHLPSMQAVIRDVQSIVSSTLDYCTYVLETLRGDVGRCFPLWAGYNNVRNNVCIDLVDYLVRKIWKLSFNICLCQPY